MVQRRFRVKELKWLAARVGIMLLLVLTNFSHYLPVLAEISAYRVVVIVETRSDWTRIVFEDALILNFTFKVTEGRDSPNLRVEVTGSEVRIHKRQYDTTLARVRIEGYLVFQGEEASITVLKGDLEYTRVEVYAVTLEGEVRVLEFLNGGVVEGSEGLNPRSTRISQRELKDALRVEVVVEELPSPRLVLAFYYPWYGNPAGPSNRWFHWSGVSYEGIASSTDYPLLGPYDSWDSKVIRSHVVMAKAAGIDGFIVSWWGIGTFEDEAFSRMLDIAAEEDFKLTIYYESVRDIGEEQIIKELVYVLEKYSGHEAFLKLEGRPVVFVYAVKAKGRDLVFWKRVVEEVERRAGVNAVFIADTYDPVFLDVFEGLHTYNPMWIEDHTSTYLKMSGIVRKYLIPEALKRGTMVRRLWCANAMPGYDDRKIRSPGSYVPRNGGSYYERTWSAAIASEPDFLLITTWNEWHEGTEVEASREYGFRYLQLTRKHASHYKGLELPSYPKPSLKLSVEEAGEGEYRLRVRNEGEGPSVVAHLYLRREGGFAVVEGYSVEVNTTTMLVFIPYIEPGGEVELKISFSGEVGSVAVEGVAWSAMGEEVKLPAIVFSVPVKEAEAGKSFEREVGLLAIAIAALSVILAYAYRVLTRK